MTKINSKYEAIILAAGKSSRMGKWKPAILINAIPMIYYSIDLFRNICDKIIIVGGYNYPELTMLVNEYRQNNNCTADIVTIENTQYEEGMLSSIIKGIHLLSDDCNMFFVMPGDMPLVKTDTCKMLLSENVLSPEMEVYIPSVDIKDGSIVRAKKGHPVLFSIKAKNAITELRNENTLRDAIKKLKVKICNVDDKGITLDIDIQSDLEIITSTNKKVAV